MSILVIVPAAGTGSRFGGGVPKQFQPLAGKPILLHTVERFLHDPSVDRVIVAVAELLLGSVKQSPGDRVRFVAGGETRQQSVLRALEAADFEPDVIAIHDAVRPFFSTEIFHKTVEAAIAVGAATPAIPVNDTIHVFAPGGLIGSTLKRDTLAAAQTPQCFRAEILRELLARAHEEGDDATDEAGLAAKYGHPVQVVPGDPLNFKITRPEDLEYAEVCLQKWSAQA